MAAVRTLMNTQLPRWSWTADETGSNVSFVAMHDRSIDVILNNQRGEGFVKQVFRLLLAGCGKGGTVIDIGSNTGYYSMASAAHGCPVLAIDAQPGCRQWFEAARAANDENATRTGAPSWFSRDRVRLITQPVSTNTQPVEIDMWACWVMHKIDVRVKRRRRRAGAISPPPPASAHASSSQRPPPPPPPPPLLTDPDAHVQPGKLALRPIDGEKLMALLPPKEQILLAKVDTEGAELGVLRALEPLLPRASNLVVEIAPGWWPLYTNRTSRRGSKQAGADVAASLAIRSVGAQQVSRLLAATSGDDEPGFGFAAALTSTGRHFTRSDRLHEFLMRMGGNGYWNQVDVWFSRDAASVKAAKKLICLRSQSAVRAKAACDKW